MAKERVFRFKRFEVSHAASPMKVGVDGVLLGAWARLPEQGSALDVGTGCGVIALMMAQRSDCRITGIDIDAGAVEEANRNFRSSPWAPRLQVKKIDFETLTGKWDCIVSNPPFFDAGLVADSARMAARHVGALSPVNLIAQAKRLLNDDGTLSLIAPADALPGLEEAAAREGGCLSRVTLVSTVEGQPSKRVLCEFSINQTNKEEGRLAIEKAPGEFTEDYISLTRDFYLRF